MHSPGKDGARGPEVWDCPHTADNGTNMHTTPAPPNLERIFGVCDDTVSDALIMNVQSARTPLSLNRRRQRGQLLGYTPSPNTRQAVGSRWQLQSGHSQDPVEL